MTQSKYTMNSHPSSTLAQRSEEEGSQEKEERKKYESANGGVEDDLVTEEESFFDKSPETASNSAASTSKLPLPQEEIDLKQQTQIKNVIIPALVATESQADDLFQTKRSEIGRSSMIRDMDTDTKSIAKLSIPLPTRQHEHQSLIESLTRRTSSQQVRVFADEGTNHNTTHTLPGAVAMQPSTPMHDRDDIHIPTEDSISSTILTAERVNQNELRELQDELTEERARRLALEQSIGTLTAKTTLVPLPQAVVLEHTVDDAESTGEEVRVSDNSQTTLKEAKCRRRLFPLLLAGALLVAVGVVVFLLLRPPPGRRKEDKKKPPPRPTTPTNVLPRQCFDSTDELKDAVDAALVYLYANESDSESGYRQAGRQADNVFQNYFEEEHQEDPPPRFIVRRYGWPMSHWCFSESLTNFSHLFSKTRNPLAQRFRMNIRGWDVSHITDMTMLFAGTTRFNQQIGRRWNISAVTSLHGTFANSIAFTQDLSSWDTSRVTDMSFALSGTRGITADLSEWDVSKVTSMQGMFQNSSLDLVIGLDQWNVASVRNLQDMFRGSGWRDSLCVWKALLPGQANVMNMFTDTKCVDESDGAFCGTCIE